MTHVLWLIVAAGLILLNSFFVAAEFSMVKLRSTRVAVIKKNGFSGKILAEVHQHLDAYLSACQLGITLASLGLGWIGEPALAQLLEPLLKTIGVNSNELIQIISFLIAFFLLSYLHIVIGELMPKSLAIRESERVSLWTAVPLYLFYWIMYPGIWILNQSSNFLLKVAKLGGPSKGENHYNAEEIKMILSASHFYGELTKEETKILAHTLDFADLKVVDIMRPIEEVCMLEIHQPIAKLIAIVMKKRYSRYPVYDNQKEKMIGILHIKDLLIALHEDPHLKTLKPLLHRPFTISDEASALHLLRRFRDGMPHFALVDSDKKNLVGFVTLDNLFHALVGHIKDEFHRTGDAWKKDKDGSILIKSSASLHALERLLGTKISIPISAEDIEIKTINGLIQAQLGAIPKIGDRIELPEFSAIIEKKTGPRVQLVRIIPKKNHEHTDNKLK